MAKEITIKITVNDDAEFKPLYKFLTYLKAQLSDVGSVESVLFTEGNKVSVYNVDGEANRLDSLITNASQEI